MIADNQIPFGNEKYMNAEGGQTGSNFGQELGFNNR